MNQAIKLSSIVKAMAEQEWCVLQEEAAILNMKTGVYYGLNAVAARIWQLVQKPQPVNTILEVLLDEYEVEAKRCERDLLELIQSMASEELIEVSDETTS